MLDQIYHDTLKEMSPDLYGIVKELIEAKQTPEQIAQFVEQRAGRDSVLPGLVEGAARTIKAKEKR